MDSTDIYWTPDRIEVFWVLLHAALWSYIAVAAVLFVVLIAIPAIINHLKKQGRNH
jgi:hypothetical protein